MGNRAVRLLGGECEGPIAADGRCSTTLDETPGLDMTASGECVPLVDEVARGDCGHAGSLGEQKPEYTSFQAKAMARSRREFLSDVDQEIEHSKVHWSEVKRHGDGGEDSNDEDAVMRENFVVFVELQNDPQWMHFKRGPFFGGMMPSSRVGRKIAEGGQAEIFEWLNDDGTVWDGGLYKVFKKGTRISQLRPQWPSGVLQCDVVHIVSNGSIIEDGRFAFGMVKCWGDLRKLIDQAMQAKNNQGPPFPFEWSGVTLHALHIMQEIALWMHFLHKKDIVHRDLKASNILLHKKISYPHVLVADFECSIGVIGTGFWRAPEILLGLKNKSAIEFSNKVDVYGFGMICYEIVVGYLPFEGPLERSRASIDQVIGGRRPTLPRDLDGALKHLIKKCWDSNPIERPTFLEIWELFDSMGKCCCDEEVVDANVFVCK